MKKTLTLIIVLTLAAQAFAQTSVIATKNTEYILEAEKGKAPQFIFYGTKLPQSGIGNFAKARAGKYPLYPTHLSKVLNEDALCITMPDGDNTVDLRVENVTEGDWTDGKTMQILCKDPVYPITVTINFKSCFDEDVIETWTEITNEGKKPVVLRRFDSGCLPLRCGDIWVNSFYGGWGNECRINSEPLRRELKVIKNKCGTNVDHLTHSELMISLDGKPRENEGRVIGAALCYGGNYELRFDYQSPEYYCFFAGIDPDISNYTLQAKETFVTPELALSWSDEGLSGVSRHFQNWGRNFRIAHGKTVNDVLLNSWEGVYMNIKEPEMHQMMKDIASMGGELFVMDDGWFGDKYPRINDHQGLGDWVADKNKLPSGIGGLVDEAGKNGIKFGLWIEPEMINDKSEVYEKHPDWVINSPSRDLVKGRGNAQLVLDLCNPAVQDHVFGIFDRIMTENPKIAYIKWDCNMTISSPFSRYLKNQDHLYIEYERGLLDVLKRIREKYPDVVIQACASGGGRVNYGTMPYFDEFWVSDDTDAYQRIFIQWGTSYFYPAETMSSHISASPNHQTGRILPLKYRIDVAMSGRLGMEIQPSTMTEEEKERCRTAISEYKTIRPVVQLGEIYRLASPYDGGPYASMLYCTPGKDKAVFFWWTLEYQVNESVPAARLGGLDPDKNYKITELDKTKDNVLPFDGQVFSGKYLIEQGLPLSPNGKDRPWASRVLYLEAD